MSGKFTNPETKEDKEMQKFSIEPKTICNDIA